MLKVALSPPRTSLSLLRRPTVCAFTCFVKFISFPTHGCLFGSQLPTQLQKSLQTTARVCACETFDGGMNRGLVRSARVSRMLVFMATDTHGLQKTALCVCTGVCVGVCCITANFPTLFETSSLTKCNSCSTDTSVSPSKA